MNTDNKKIVGEHSGKRIACIDHAKGLGMILVVAGHINSSLFLIPFLYAFHMPLFFFLSGVTFKESKANREGLMKISKRLLYPYVSYAIFILALIFITELAIRPLFGHFQWSKVAGVAIQVRDSVYTVGLWFLPLLFVSEVMLIAVIRYIKNVKLRRTVIIVTLSMGLIYAFHNLPKLPWAVDAALIAMPFIYLGFESKRIISYLTSLSSLKSIALCAMFFMLTLIFCRLNLNYVPNRVDMWASSYGNPIYFILGAVCGIAFAMILVIEAYKWLNIKILEYVGRNSLHIYCAHVSIIFPIVALALAIIGLHNDGKSAGVYSLYFAIAIILCLIYVAIINHLRPYRDKFIHKLSNFKGSR